MSNGINPEEAAAAEAAAQAAAEAEAAAAEAAAADAVAEAEEAAAQAAAQAEEGAAQAAAATESEATLASNYVGTDLNNPDPNTVLLYPPAVPDGTLDPLHVALQNWSGNSPDPAGGIDDGGDPDPSAILFSPPTAPDDSPNPLHAALQLAAGQSSSSSAAFQNVLPNSDQGFPLAPPQTAPNVESNTASVAVEIPSGNSDVNASYDSGSLGIQELGVPENSGWVQSTDQNKPPGLSSISERTGLPTFTAELPTGIGTADPFGLEPSREFLDYSQPTLFEQLATGIPSAGRSNVLIPGETGFWADMNFLLFAENYHTVQLRPSLRAFELPSAGEQAFAKVFVTVGMAVGPGLAGAGETMLAEGLAQDTVLTASDELVLKEPTNLVLESEPLEEWTEEEFFQLKGEHGYHLHHVFPDQLEEEFEEIGIDVDEWTYPMQDTLHSWLHSPNGGNWNELWQKWLYEEALPKGLGREDAAEFAKQLFQQYKIPFNPRNLMRYPRF